jgi:hypothetical protein
LISEASRALKTLFKKIVDSKPLKVLRVLENLAFKKIFTSKAIIYNIHSTYLSNNDI